MATSKQIQNIIQHYAPVYIKQGVLDVDKTAQKIADWSVEFFGDPALETDGHYHIRTQVPDFHMELYCDLMSHYRLYYMTCPSDSGKTTHVSLIYPIYSHLYFNEPHIVLSSRVEDTTIGMLDSIKFEFEDNQKFISIYGDLKGDPKTSNRYYRDDLIETTKGGIFRAVQVGGNIRGRKRGSWRITLAIVDDPEELVDIESPKELMKHWDWINRSLEKRLDIGFGKLRLVGTRIGPNCCVERAIKDTRWKGKSYKALIEDDVTGNKKSFWEEKYPVSFLVAERLEAIRNKDLVSWMYERQNDPPVDIQRNLRGYRFHNLQYFRRNDQNVLIARTMKDLTGEDDNKNLYLADDPVPVNIYCSIDPAFANTANADPRAVVVFALGRILKTNELYGDPYWLNCIWILEYLYNWMSPEIIINVAHEFHKKYYLQGLTIEAISGAAIYESIMLKRFSGDRFFFDNPMSLQFLKWQPKDKGSRIYASLQPKVKFGQFYLRSDHVELIEECEIFDPDNIHLLDAIEFGLRSATTNVIDYKNAGNNRQELARQSRRDYVKKLKPVEEKSYGIPHSLNQIFGR